MNNLEQLCRLVRYNILTSTTVAGSGHPTSSLSAVELMTSLFFGGIFQADFENFTDINNDKIIFSKGHAAPLLYSLYQAAGLISRDELMTLRKFGSRLEGHPTPKLPFIDVPTGSLGQGLSVGIGMALGMKLRKSHARTFVLLGDSEMSEGQNWEALQIASYYKLNNIIGILDVNRLGQRGETMLGWDIAAYEKRTNAFGWRTIIIEDGHDLKEINSAYQTLNTNHQSPTMLIAKTIKGKGVSFLENQENWHGKPIPKDKLELALKEIGKVDLNLKGKIARRDGACLVSTANTYDIHQPTTNNLPSTIPIATREAYGNALINLGKKYPDLVVLDAETSNSTYAEKFKKEFPERFFEMFIAEQNMVSVAVGLSKMGFIPFISTFAAFLTRAFDQIRMAQYANANIKIAGSHAGVSIGEDGSSQMGLEDIAMMRSILKSNIYYPSDATTTAKIAEEMINNQNICYLRLTRGKTPSIYSEKEKFPAGGSKILKHSNNDRVVVFAAGITLFEALTAYESLHREGINIAIVDLYSIKPLDEKTINQFAIKTKNVLVVEDHYPDGGISDAVKAKLNNTDVNFYSLSVKKTPCSGSPEELLHYEEIDSQTIIKKIKEIIQH